MFDIGFSEIVLIAIVGLLVIDPQELPDLMFKAGRFFRQFKLIMSRVSDTIGDVMHELEVESYRRDYRDKQEVMNRDEQSDIAQVATPHITQAPSHVTGNAPDETRVINDATDGAGRDE